MKPDRLLRSCLALLAIASVPACAASPPLGYTGGVRWDIPLIAPLDGPELAVPAMIQDSGPYLFILDPDQQVSLIDRDVAESLGLFTPPDSWIGVVDARDRIVRRRPYEVLDFSAGELRLRHVRMYSAKPGSMTFNGLPVAGVLGTEFLSRTIVIDVDRDRGLVRLALTGHQSQPGDATRIAGRLHKRRPPIRKVVVPVMVLRGEGTNKLELAVDLAARKTAVWPDHLPNERAPVHIGDVRVDNVRLATFKDRRADEADYDGVLGQDVLSRYRVRVDQDKRVLWLGPRATDPSSMTAERISRWGDMFKSCQRVGCVRATTDDRGPLLLYRDAQAPRRAFDVVLQPVDAKGAPIPGFLRAHVDEGVPPERPIVVTGVATGVGARAAGYRVVDVSPFSLRNAQQPSERLWRLRAHLSSRHRGDGCGPEPRNASAQSMAQCSRRGKDVRTRVIGPVSAVPFVPGLLGRPVEFPERVIR